MMTINKKNVSFTLAEVLITLAIIGIIGALTIPAVVRSYQERETVVKVKKFYSEINRALQKAEFDKGRGIKNYRFTNSSFINFIRPYMNIVKICATNDKSCFYDGKYKNLNPKATCYRSSIFGSKIILKDGQHVAIDLGNYGRRDLYYASWHGVPNFIGLITLDVNGSKPPNQWGVDTFGFAVSDSDKIVPLGLIKHTNSLWHYCSKGATDRENGIDCAGWVISKGNMDYLRRAVSW